MRIGVVAGTGPAGKGIALRLAAAGHEVLLGSRDPARGASVAARLLEEWPGRGLALAGGANEAAAVQDLVVLAAPWDAAAETARGLRAALEGRVVVSMANALVRVGRAAHALVPARGSLVATLQGILPGSSVTGAFHHLPAGLLQDLDAALEADVLVCGADAVARRTTIELASSIPGLRGLDAGGLESAGPIESLTAVLLSVNLRYRAHASLRLTGLDVAAEATPHRP